jgi:hypothetical protein
VYVQLSFKDQAPVLLAKHAARTPTLQEFVALEARPTLFAALSMLDIMEMESPSASCAQLELTLRVVSVSLCEHFSAVTRRDR